MLRVTVATVLTGFLHYVGITLFFEAMPISYILFGMIIQFCLIIGIRFSYRFCFIGTQPQRKIREGRRTKARISLLIGAGDAGRLILRDVSENRV